MFTVKTRDNKQYELPLSCIPEGSASSLAEVPCSSKLFEHIVMYLVDGIPIKEKYSEVSKRVLSEWLQQQSEPSDITVASAAEADSLVSSGKQYKKIIISDEFEGSLTFLKSQRSVVKLIINPKAIVTDDSITGSLMHLSSLEGLSLPNYFENAYELSDLSRSLVNLKKIRNYRDRIHFLKDFTKLEVLSTNRVRNIHFLKSSLKKLILLDDFNGSIEALSGLTDLETLIFGFKSYFNRPIEPLSALTNLKNLTFGWDFNRPIKPLSALTKLETLEFGFFFNRPIESLSALTNLKSLTFGWHFDQPIESLSALTNLKTLTFGECFDQSIEVLRKMSNLENLDLGNKYDRPIEPLSALTTNLKKLKFGYKFNQPIEPLKALKNLESLTFGYKFDQPIEPLRSLNNLKTLSFGNNFNKELDAVEGSAGSLESLTFRNEKQAELSAEFLSKFKKLKRYSINGREIEVRKQ